jgi:hypothetical protein
MLALNATEGDVAIRTDSDETYILTNLPATNLANWELIGISTGKTQNVITDGVTNKAPSMNAVSDALKLKANIDSPTFTGVPLSTPLQQQTIVKK